MKHWVRLWDIKPSFPTIKGADRNAIFPAQARNPAFRVSLFEDLLLLPVSELRAHPLTMSDRVHSSERRYRETDSNFPCMTLHDCEIRRSHSAREESNSTRLSKLSARHSHEHISLHAIGRRQPRFGAGHLYSVVRQHTSDIGAYQPTEKPAGNSYVCAGHGPHDTLRSGATRNASI